MHFAKYIIVEKSGLETAILLHPSVAHQEAVNAAQLEERGGRLISAGYFTLAGGAVTVDLDQPSTTLHLHPRPQDAETIKNTLILTGLSCAA